MTILSAWAARGRALFADTKGPWGSPPSGSDDTPEPSRPSGPWGSDEPRRKGEPSSPGASLEDFLARNRGRFGGGGSGGGGGGSGINRWFFKWGVLAFVAAMLALSSCHVIAQDERGVVTMVGRYQSTLAPGFNVTLPAPIMRVQKVNVAEIREVQLGATAGENLMLTGDQNILDIAYLVRWSIRDPEQYLFELAQPEETIKQVAESAMREVVAQVTLQDAMGARRGAIEASVQEEMQRVLDRYQAGISVRGVAVKQADPPNEVNDAFKDVTAAQQDAQSEINKANAYALQLRQLAQGEATAFDKVYEQYKLAPEVTRRRMYYETMERVLKTVDKTIVETPGVTPYLPLPEVKKRAVEQAR